MPSQTRKKLLVASPVNYVVEINETLNAGTRRGHPVQLLLPRMFDRAFLVVHEGGVLPITEVISTPGMEGE